MLFPSNSVRRAYQSCRYLCRASRNSSHTSDHVEDKTEKSIVKNRKSRAPAYRRMPTLLTLMKQETAQKIMEMIRNRVCLDDTPVLEMHAGPGHLTEEMLKAGVENLHVYEPRDAFSPHLKDLLKTFDKGTYRKQSIYSLFYDGGAPASAESEHVSKMLPHKDRLWNDEPSFRIVGAHGSVTFWLWLLIYISRITKKQNLGRPEILLCSPEKEWKKVSERESASKFGRHPSGSLFPVCFEWDVLGNIPRRDFLPLKVGETMSDAEQLNMTLLRLAPIRNLFSVIAEEEVDELMFFIRQYLNRVTKSQRIIPALEKWIPGCGRNLVLEAGIDITTKFKDLSPEGVLAVFHTFKSHSSYVNSAFFSNSTHCEPRYNIASSGWKSRRGRLKKV